MLNRLEKRGDALKSANFEKASAIEKEMTQFKNENFDELTVPKYFYCTFHTEHAYNLAQEMNQLKLLGEIIELKQATEPTDIIWEHRNIRKSERGCRCLVVSLIMAILCLMSFTFIIFLLKTRLAFEYKQSPPGISCARTVEAYGEDLR